jgi:hypothetical protein
MRRTLFTPSTSPTQKTPDRLLLFIQQAQLDLVYERRRERRLPLHDSFRLTLSARTPDDGARRQEVLKPTIYYPGPDLKPAA